MRNRGGTITYLKVLECSRCGQEHDPEVLQGLCRECGSPLLARYDLETLAGLDRGVLAGRPPDMWRYEEVMPSSRRDEIVSLGEGMTPLLPLAGLQQSVAGIQVLTKNEAVNPTGSFKARGLSAAVTMARRLGAARLAIPSAGNAGGALAAYGTCAGLETHVFVPADTPAANVLETQLTATSCHLIEGVISDAGREVAARCGPEGWFDVSTLKEPYRIEGKKTMGYEIAEQLGWELPDAIFYPTGGGTGLIGMWKAFDEMEALGWIDDRRPRMVAVQSEGCAPIVRAFEEGTETAAPWEDPVTMAAGIRVPKALGDFLILRAVRESGGCAVAVSEAEIYAALAEVAAGDGLFCCPEGAACVAALHRLRDEGWLRDGERVVIFNTGAGAKYVNVVQAMREAFAGA